MLKKKILLYISVIIFLIWIIFERSQYLSNKIKIKQQILKLLINSNQPEFKNYYNNSDINNLIKEIYNYNSEEQAHLLNTYSNTFLNRSSNNISSFINRITSFQQIRSLENKDLVDQCLDKLSDKYISCIDKMLWFPYVLRLLFNYLNYQTLKKWKELNNFNTFKNKNVIIYSFSNYQPSKKNLIIFLGLGGIFKPFENIIDLFYNKDYNIIFPIYKSAQADLRFSIDIHEASFYQVITNYLIDHKIYNVEIFSWSLGGILYKGFEKYLQINNFEKRKVFEPSNKSKIDRVFLIEPLISSRGGIDTYFSQIRSFKNTISIFNNLTNYRYLILNFLFSYLIHSEIGFIASNSFGYFNNIELKHQYNKTYPRYLFLSSNDVIINYQSDKDLIENNFESDKVFYREGYHGGWMLSSRLVSIFKKIIISENNNL